MANEYYMTNNNKLLLMVKELHLSGFEKLRVIPSVAPNGLAWRCTFIDESKLYECVASNWIIKIESETTNGEIKQSPKELANVFIKDNFDFIQKCKGENKEYSRWFANMIDHLEKDELPFAFHSEFRPTNYWKTTKEKRILTLPNEKDYYFY